MRPGRLRIVLSGGVDRVEPLLRLRPRAQGDAPGPFQELPRLGHAPWRAGSAADLREDAGSVNLPEAQDGGPFSRSHGFSQFVGAPGVHRHSLAYIWSAVCWAWNRLVM